MNQKIMVAFGFTADDLAHNQEGRLSPDQTERLKKNMRKNKRIFLILGIITLIIAIYFAIPYIQAMSFNGAKLLNLLGPVALLALSVLFFSGLFEKTDAAIMQSEGRVQFISKESAIDDDGTQVSKTYFYIVVGKDTFSVEPEQYDAFTQGHRYRVFSVQKTLFLTGILSIEYLGE